MPAGKTVEEGGLRGIPEGLFLAAIIRGGRIHPAVPPSWTVLPGDVLHFTGEMSGFARLCERMGLHMLDHDGIQGRHQRCPAEEGDEQHLTQEQDEQRPAEERDNQCPDRERRRVDTRGLERVNGGEATSKSVSEINGAASLGVRKDDDVGRENRAWPEGSAADVSSPLAGWGQGRADAVFRLFLGRVRGGPSSRLAGVALRNSDVRRRLGAAVLSIRRGGQALGVTGTTVLEVRQREAVILVRQGAISA